jgi:hypothetical protein
MPCHYLIHNCLTCYGVYITPFIPNEYPARPKGYHIISSYCSCYLTFFIVVSHHRSFIVCKSVACFSFLTSLVTALLQVITHNTSRQGGLSPCGVVVVIWQQKRPNYLKPTLQYQPLITMHQRLARFQRRPHHYHHHQKEGHQAQLHMKIYLQHSVYIRR